MTAKDAIRQTMDLSSMILDSYIKDLEDADLLLRPVAGMNPIAWQLGHLIGSERHFLELAAPGSSPELPEGFNEAHGKDRGQSDDTSGYLPLARYQALMKAQREATLRTFEACSEADLDRADPERFPPYIPTVGALFNMIGVHPLMHAGQFVAVRRVLKKPVSI